MMEGGNASAFNEKKNKYKKLKQKLAYKMEQKKSMILKKTSKDRTLEKSILSRSNQDNSSFEKRQVLLNLNRSLAVNVQGLKLYIRELQSKLDEVDAKEFARNCEIYSLRNKNIKLESKIDELKSELTKTSNESTEAIGKCKDLLDILINSTANRRNSDLTNSLVHDSILRSRSLPLMNLELNSTRQVFDSSVKWPNVVQEAKNNFDMTVIHEEISQLNDDNTNNDLSLIEANVEDCDKKLNSTNSDKENTFCENDDEDFHKEMAMKRKTYVVINSLQTEPLPTPKKLTKKIRRSQQLGTSKRKSGCTEILMPATEQSSPESTGCDTNYRTFTVLTEQLLVPERSPPSQHLVAKTYQHNEKEKSRIQTTEAHNQDSSRFDKVEVEFVSPKEQTLASKENQPSQHLVAKTSQYNEKEESRIQTTEEHNQDSSPFGKVEVEFVSSTEQTLTSRNIQLSRQMFATIREEANKNEEITLPTTEQRNLDFTRLDIVDMEFTVSLNTPIITPKETVFADSTVREVEFNDRLNTNISGAVDISKDVPEVDRGSVDNIGCLSKRLRLTEELPKENQLPNTIKDIDTNLPEIQKKKAAKTKKSTKSFGLANKRVNATVESPGELTVERNNGNENDTKKK